MSSGQGVGGRQGAGDGQGAGGGQGVGGGHTNGVAVEDEHDSEAVDDGVIESLRDMSL